MQRILKGKFIMKKAISVLMVAACMLCMVTACEKKNKKENYKQNEHNNQEQTVRRYQYYEVFIFSGIHNKNPPERYYYSIL